MTVVYFCIGSGCICKFSIKLKYLDVDSCAKTQQAGYWLKLQGNFIIFHHLLTLTLVSNIEKGSIYILSPLLSDNDDRDDIDGRLACCELVSIISSPPTPTFIKTGLDKGFVSKVAPSSITKQCKRQQWLGAKNCQRAHNRNMF